MTLEQAAVVIAGYLITYIITSVKNGRLLTFNKQETNKNVDKKFSEFQDELDKRDEKISTLSNELLYYRSTRISDLKVRLEMTSDEKERQAILDELETLSKFK